MCLPLARLVLVIGHPIAKLMEKISSISVFKGQGEGVKEEGGGVGGGEESFW